jgi:hypothetical protein
MPNVSTRRVAETTFRKAAGPRKTSEVSLLA